MDSQYTSQGDVSQPNDSTPLTSVGTDAGTGSNLQVDFVFLAKIENAQIVASIINTSSGFNSSPPNLFLGCQCYPLSKRYQVDRRTSKKLPSKHVLGTTK
eukprot:TRINITY_DN4698_c0_g1_i1.p1 TRINITY_DN4698_c0_g1~~TRINITY_DN4698_c0_g1_i1.p1  ORF type:complete len:107 (-),score=14.68 TRINITY_DN4698_c0_g1_i1:71-370(-)